MTWRRGCTGRPKELIFGTLKQWRPRREKTRERVAAKDKLGKVTVMATKNKKSTSRLQAKKKPAASSKKTAKKKTVSPAATSARDKSPARRGAKLLSDSVLGSCPSRQYAGEVDIDDARGRATLVTQFGPYLMMIDRGCTGVFDPNGVTADHETFRRNPAPHGPLTCQGFLHEDAQATVLHVVG